MTTILANILKTIFPTTLVQTPIVFGEKAISALIKIRLGLARAIMPKDMRIFLDLILERLNMEYESLDDAKRDKISTLTITFDFRE